MIRVDMSMEEPTFRRFQSQGRPSVALLAQDIWTAIQPTEEIREVCALRCLPLLVRFPK